MVTTLSAEKCKTKERFLRARKKKFFLEKSIKVSFYNENSGL